MGGPKRNSPKRTGAGVRLGPKTLFSFHATQGGFLVSKYACNNGQ